MKLRAKVTHFAALARFPVVHFLLLLPICAAQTCCLEDLATGYVPSEWGYFCATNISWLYSQLSEAVAPSPLSSAGGKSLEQNILLLPNDEFAST